MDDSGSAPAPELPAKFTRFQALCVDVIMGAGTVWLASLCLARWMVTGLVGTLVLLAALSALQAVSILRKGATLGQMLVSLRLVDFKTGGPVTAQAAWHWSVMRAALCLALLSEHLPFLFLGLLFYITILTDRQQRSLYDDWAGVQVVRG